MPKRVDTEESDFDGEAEYVSPLYEFEGLGVYGTAVAMPNAGGGIHEALEVEPFIGHIGELGFAVVKFRVRGVNHLPMKVTKSSGVPEGGLQRAHALHVEAASIATDEMLETIIADTQRKVRERRDALRGQDLLPGTEAV